MDYPQQYVERIAPEMTQNQICDQMLHDKVSIPFALMVLRIVFGVELVTAQSMLIQNDDWSNHFKRNFDDPRVVSFVKDCQNHGIIGEKFFK